MSCLSLICLPVNSGPSGVLNNNRTRSGACPSSPCWYIPLHYILTFGKYPFKPYFLPHFHPQSNGQTERSSIWRRCCAAWLPRTPPSGPNSCLGQSMPSTPIVRPPLVDLLSSAPWVTSRHFVPDQEEEAGVPSAEAFVRHCHRTWRRTCSALLRSSARMKAQTPRYRQGHAALNQGPAALNQGPDPQDQIP